MAKKEKVSVVRAKKSPQLEKELQDKLVKRFEKMLDKEFPDGVPEEMGPFVQKMLSQAIVFYMWGAKDEKLRASIKIVSEKIDG